MSRPSFTSGSQAANHNASKLNPKLDGGLLAPAAILTTSARLVLVVALLAVGAHAQIYSAAADFSAATNTDTSRWSYRYNTTGTRDGNYLLLPNNGPSGSTWYNWGEPNSLPMWFSQPNTVLCPCIGANKLTIPLVSNFGFGPIVGPPRSILEHPSVTSDVGDTVLSFLVPKAGTVTVTFSFTDIDPYGGNGIDWYVDLNSGLAGDLYSGTVDSTPGHLSTTGDKKFQIIVAEGDRLNFIIDSNGNFDFDSTAMRAIIAY
jgi:hypothetical protein